MSHHAAKGPPDERMSAPTASRATYRTMLAFYLPLAAAQLLQGIRNPVLDAGVSRGLNPETSLAAFGVVGSLIQLLGAAGIVVQSAYLVLVRGRESYRFFRRYAALYIGFVLVLAGLVATPGLGQGFFTHVMGSAPDLVEDVMPIMRICLLVPVFNLIRLFFLAELVHRRQTHVVWMSPAVGEALMAGLALGVVPRLPVAAGIGAAAAWLLVSVAEALVMFAFARRAQRRDPYGPDAPGERRLDVRYATAFALPLVITQFTLAAGNPVASAGLLRLADPELSVAGYRVAFSLVMLSTGPLATLRQVVLVMAREPQDHPRVRFFCTGVSFGIFAGVALIAFTPLNRLMLGTVIGAPPEIVNEAIPALQVFAPFPLVMGWRQFYAALSMHQHKTAQVAVAAATRLGMLYLLAFVMPGMLGWSGAWVGALARTTGNAAEAGVNFGFGRRYYGRAALVRRRADASPAERSAGGPIIAKQPH